GVAHLQRGPADIRRWIDGEPVGQIPGSPVRGGRLAQPGERGGPLDRATAAHREVVQGLAYPFVVWVQHRGDLRSELGSGPVREVSASVVEVGEIRRAAGPDRTDGLDPGQDGG